MARRLIDVGGRVVDLSHPIGSGMPTYPGDPAVAVTQLRATSVDGYLLHNLELGSQTGTHVDAPVHVLDDGLTTTQISAVRLVGRAVIADVRSEQEKPIEACDLAGALREVKQGDFLLLRTGWESRWGSTAYWHSPEISLDAARAIIDAGVSLVGIDAGSIEGADRSLPVHQAFARAEVLIVENLCRLEQLDKPDPLVVVGMLPITGIDGAPARVFGIYPA